MMKRENCIQRGPLGNKHVYLRVENSTGSKVALLFRNIMKTTTRRLGLFIGLIACHSSIILANVTITSPTGGNNISADKALNSTNGTAFTALGSIVITEGAASDIAAGNSQTLILSVPPGWKFNPGVGTVTFTGTRNITAATISV